MDFVQFYFDGLLSKNESYGNLAAELINIFSKIDVIDQISNPTYNTGLLSNL